MFKNETLKAKPNSDPSRFTREEAKRTLDEVRRRYGIHESAPPAHPRVDRSLIVPREPAEQTRPTLRTEPSAPIPSNPTRQIQSNPRLGRARARHPNVPASGSAADNENFYYLIRIAECALTLLCEVTADSEATARHRVKQIPNLLEWREICGEEFVSLVGDFASHVPSGPVRFMGDGCEQV
jgi:hypothetical protein